MLACAACGTFQGPICPRCRRTLTAGPQLRTGGVVVSAAHEHRGAARRLVHQLKYTGSPAAARLLGAAMAGVLPPRATAVVPVPRAVLRRWRHGVDPAVTLAGVIGAETGLPVVAALRPGWWWRRHAGAPGARRSVPRWTPRTVPRPGWVLVDDVATTGATLQAAAATLGGVTGLGVVATSPGRVGTVGAGEAPPSREVMWPDGRVPSGDRSRRPATS